MIDEFDQAFERTRSLLDEAIQNQRRDLDLELPGVPSRHFVPVTIFGAVIIFSATLIWAQHSGLGDTSVDETGAEIVASALVFIAVILTESIVVIGLLLTHHSNQRQHRLAVFDQLRLKSDASRTAAQGLIDISRQATDSELGAKRQNAEFERLRHDSAIKAIELLADDEAFGRSGRRCVVINTLIGLG